MNSIVALDIQMLIKSHTFGKFSESLLLKIQKRFNFQEMKILGKSVVLKWKVKREIWFFSGEVAQWMKGSAAAEYTMYMFACLQQ